MAEHSVEVETHIFQAIGSSLRPHCKFTMGSLSIKLNYYQLEVTKRFFPIASGTQPSIAL
uniref:Uncharacterized protein n=1 Tax=Megaselia scalaris TaxID=36166 RepID=T1GK80_MEGSC